MKQLFIFCHDGVNTLSELLGTRVCRGGICNPAAFFAGKRSRSALSMEALGLVLLGHADPLISCPCVGSSALIGESRELKPGPPNSFIGTAKKEHKKLFFLPFEGIDHSIEYREEKNKRT